MTSVAQPWAVQAVNVQTYEDIGASQDDDATPAQLQDGWTWDQGDLFYQC